MCTADQTTRTADTTLITADATICVDVVDAGVALVPAAGGWWADQKHPAERWEARRKKLKELDDLIRKISGQIPDDVPEKQVAKAAVAKVERAAAITAHPVLKQAPPPPLEVGSLLASIAQAEAALLHYKARKTSEALEQFKSKRLAELIQAAEEDDEDVMLLLNS